MDYASNSQPHPRNDHNSTVYQWDSNTRRAGTFPQQVVVDDGDYPDLRIEDDLLDSADEIMANSHGVIEVNRR